jgi:hypothetical protein
MSAEFWWGNLKETGHFKDLRIILCGSEINRIGGCGLDSSG